MRVLISYVVAIVVFTFLSVNTAKLHLLVEQEQLTLSELLRSPPFVAGFLLLDLYVWCFVDLCLFLVIELSVLRLTDSGYPLDIFKLFLMKEYIYAWDFALICPME